MQNKLVSIVIPTKNASQMLSACLQKIRKQNYKNVEIIVVDGKSPDWNKTKQIAKKYNCKFYTIVTRVKRGLYDATDKRNYGANLAKGEYIYNVDADMELTPNILDEAVKLCDGGFDAVIIPEDSFGIGPWARAKNLERRFFWGDDTIESPRFFKKRVWDKLGGFDKKMGSAEDRDMHQRILEAGYKVARTKNMLMHNEGELTLKQVFQKQFRYKREILKYIQRRPLVGIKSYIPLRISHIVNWRMFASRPGDTFLLVIMKSVESFAGVLGILCSLTIDKISFFDK